MKALRAHFQSTSFLLFPKPLSLSVSLPSVLTLSTCLLTYSKSSHPISYVNLFSQVSHSISSSCPLRPTSFAFLSLASIVSWLFSSASLVEFYVFINSLDPLSLECHHLILLLFSLFYLLTALIVPQCICYTALADNQTDI